MKYQAPFRVGKKQSRAVLDSLGHTVVVFQKGDEYLAQEYCDFYNSTLESQVEQCADELANDLLEKCFIMEIKDGFDLKKWKKVFVKIIKDNIEAHRLLNKQIEGLTNEFLDL